jgi:hypothetical protein
MPKTKKSRKKSRVSVLLHSAYKVLHDAYHLTIDFLGRDLV